MRCPSCEMEGLETEMVELEILRRSDLVGYRCPADRGHWEVMKREHGRV